MKSTHYIFFLLDTIYLRLTEYFKKVDYQSPASTVKTFRNEKHSNDYNFSSYIFGDLGQELTFKMLTYFYTHKLPHDTGIPNLFKNNLFKIDTVLYSSFKKSQ